MCGVCFLEWVWVLFAKCSVVVGSEIAQGGYSFVYNARDTLTGEAFALKKILCQTEDQIEMAKQEIQMHKSFAHPHIMPLSDYAVLSVDANALEYYLLFPFMEVRATVDCAFPCGVAVIDSCW